MAMEREVLSTNRKALRINLNDSIFGSFAEIGGGQEAARNFFQAGGASGTIAKTISAYDKSFSDALYNNNKTGRYVSQGRLGKMLDKEYSELVQLLENKRQIPTRYFAYANTVSTLNFKKDNKAHGWLGIRFQLEPKSPPNEIIMHIKLLENDGLQQQHSLGILGVNLIFACFNYHQTPNTFLKSLLDNLSTDSIEITMVRMSGPGLDYVDNRLLSVQLVNNGMTPATVFDRNGKVQQPDDMLYKKNVLAFRGSFRPITYVGFDMLKSSYAIFKKDQDYDKDNTLPLCELTLNNLLEEGSFDERDFLNRVDLLNGMGQNVMVSNFREYYKLVSYFSQFKIKNLRIVIGVPTLSKVLDKMYYSRLKGGILEAFGKLFPDNMKMYVYPSRHKEQAGLLTSENISISDDIKPLMDYLRHNRKIIDITDVKKERLHINSRLVLEKIKNGDESWDEMVPAYVSKTIREKEIFGYKKK